MQPSGQGDSRRSRGWAGGRGLGEGQLILNHSKHTGASTILFFNKTAFKVSSWLGFLGGAVWFCFF